MQRQVFPGRRREPEHTNQREIQQHRRGGRDGELAMRVQNTADHGAERHHEQIGHGDLGQQDRQLENVRLTHKPRPQQIHQPRHHQLRPDDQDQHGRHQHGGDIPGEFLGIGQALAFQLAGIERHEGGVESPLGENPAEEIGKLERRQEGVGDGACPQRPRQKDLAHKTEKPAAQGHDADNGRGSQKTHTYLRTLALARAMPRWAAFSSKAVSPSLNTARRPVLIRSVMVSSSSFFPLWVT